MSVLVDTSIWVDYFRSGGNSEKLDFLIDEFLTRMNSNRREFPRFGKAAQGRVKRILALSCWRLSRHLQD